VNISTNLLWLRKKVVSLPFQQCQESHHLDLFPPYNTWPLHSLLSTDGMAWASLTYHKTLASLGFPPFLLCTRKSSSVLLVLIKTVYPHPWSAFMLDREVIIVCVLTSGDPREYLYWGWSELRVSICVNGFSQEAMSLDLGEGFGETSNAINSRHRLPQGMRHG
jgi:hypothetical protein